MFNRVARFRHQAESGLYTECLIGLPGSGLYAECLIELPDLETKQDLDYIQNV